MHAGRDCPARRVERVRVNIDDHPAFRAEEAVNVGSPRSLSVRAAENGGIHVVGASSGGYEVRACKAAAFEEDLGKIRVQVRGNEVSADGPDSGTRFAGSMPVERIDV